MRPLFSLITLISLLFCQTHNAAADEAARQSQDRSAKRLEETVLNQNLTLEKRVKALKVLMADEMQDGFLNRTFCIWDPLGKAGPIAGAANDQILRSMHYGMKLSIEVFQDETAIKQAFLDTTECDAILIRGAAARPFNSFLSTLEAPGALPDRDHLQLLAQVLAKPAIAPKLTNDKYTALGVITIGSQHLFASSAALASTSALQNSSLAVSDADQGYVRLIEKFGGSARSNALNASVLAFSAGLSQQLIAPDIGYLMAGVGLTDTTNVALDIPLGQSTLQLVGHADRFPAGLAQILREDFLFRFHHYARLLDKELGNLPASFWLTPTQADIERLTGLSRSVRIELRNKGYYDADMLKLARKIRCRFTPDADECKNPVE